MIIDLIALQETRDEVLGKAKNALERQEITVAQQWASIAEEYNNLLTQALLLQRHIKDVEISTLNVLINENATEIQVSHQDQGELGELSEDTTNTGRNESEKKRFVWIRNLRIVHNVSLLGHGRIYQSSKNKQVGVVIGKEVVQKPNKWLLTLPDQNYDVVVLLCETLCDEIIDFILPVEDIDFIRKEQKKNYKLVKFNIIRENGIFFLVNRRSRIFHLNDYIAKYDYLV